MSAEEFAGLEEQFSRLLAACDDALAAGGPVPMPPEDEAPAELRSRLEREVSWCRMVRCLLSDGPSAASRLPAGPPPLQTPAAPPPAHLGRFRVVRELGRGGFGVVFLAFDPKLNREVALKVPRPEAVLHPELRARFQQEARAMAGLDHPNLVPVYEAGEEGAVCYIASAYCPGITLRAWLKQRGEPAPFGLAARLVVELAEAVQHAHCHGILHRDLKPANVMLSLRSPKDSRTGRASEGSETSEVSKTSEVFKDVDFTARIMDFGLAKELQDEDAAHSLEHLTQSGSVLGTPAYMAPEQAGGQNGAVGPATDVYALGAILYELLTARPPFQGDSIVETLLLVRTEDPLLPTRLRARLPRDLETICLKCLHKDPRKRYPTAQALADDLRRYLNRQPIEARRVGPIGRLILWCRRKPALAATIALAFVTVTAVAGIGFHQVLQERERYRIERDQAQANLYRALAGEARALMQGRDTGWWWKAMDNIRQASALEAGERDRGELRELAIECMGGKHPCLRLHGTWDGHRQPITSLAFSGDGRLAASAAHDPTIRLWSVPDGQPVAILSGHSGPVTGVVFHPAGRWLASSSADGSVRLWDVGQSVGNALRGVPEGGVAASMANHGTPQRALATVFDLKAGAVNAVEFSPDGASLAAACQNGDIHVLKLDQGEIGEKAGHTVLSARAGPVTCLAFSSTGRLASGSANKTIRLWDLATSQQTDYWALVNAPNALAFNPQGTMLAWSEPAIFGVHLRVLQTSLGYEHAQLHTSAVQQIRYDPRGRLVTASADGALKLWTLGYAGRLEETAVGRGAWGEVRAVAVHPAGNWVVSGHADGKVRIWELAEPPQRKLLETGRSQQAAFVGSQRCLVNDNGLRDFSRGWEGAATAFPIAAITALAVHPAGRRFAFGNENGALAVGDLERPGAVVSCVGHRQRINFLASSPDGKHLASASADGTVRLWNWETGSGSRTIEPGLGALHGMAWGAGNRSLVVVGDRGAAVWDVDRPAKGRTIGRPSSRADSVAAFADLVALSGPDGTVEVSELPTGRRRHTLRGHTATVSALEFSPDGSLLASGAADGSIRLWQTATGAEAGVFQHSGLVASFLAFDPRGRYLASDSTHACLIWEIRSKSPAVQFNDPGLHARFVADGSAVLVGTRAGSILRCTSGEIEQARAGARGATELSSSQFVPVDLSTTVVQGGHNGTVWGIAASPDGRWIATASHDQTVKLWDAQTLKLVRTLEGHQAVVWCVAFSPDSKYLASGSAEAGEGAVTVWDVATGRAHRRFHGHRGLVLGLAFHPERPWVASSSIDGSVCLWDVDAGRALGLLHQFDRGVYSVAFRPAGRCLAASCLDARVAVWDLAEPLSGAAPPSRFLAGHTAAVYCVGFSADGRYLASGSEQGGIMLWDAQTFAPITTLRGGTGQIRNIAFSRDGALLAGAAYVTPTIVWDLNLLRHTLAEMNLDW